MNENVKKVLLSVLKYIGVSAITFLIAGPLSFFAEGVNNQDNSYALIATVKSVWAVSAQAIAAGAAVFLFRIVGGALDNDISRGRIKERPLTLRESIGYVFETGKINVIVYLAISAVAMVAVIIIKSTAKYAVQALYNPMFFSNGVIVIIFGDHAWSRIVGQCFGTLTFPILYFVEFYLVQKIRFKRFNRRISGSHK